MVKDKNISGLRLNKISFYTEYHNYERIRRVGGGLMLICSTVHWIPSWCGLGKAGDLFSNIAAFPIAKRTAIL